MEIEQLKLILETVNSFGGGAKTFAIVYVAFKTLTYILGYGCLLFAIVLSYKIGKQALIDNLFVYKLRTFVGPGRDWGYLTLSDKEKIVNAIKRGLSNATSKGRI